MKDLQDNESFNLTREAEDVRGGLSDKLRQSAREVAEEAQELAGTVTEKGRQVASQQVYRGKEQVARTLESLGGIALDAADRLRREGNEGLSDLARRAARGLGRTSDFVRRQQLGDLVPQVENLARRRPVLFLGGFFAIGFALARFLKSSGGGERAWARSTNGAAFTPSPIYTSEARI